MYKVTLLSDAEDSFRHLDKSVQVRIADKIDWLAENAGVVIHHQLKAMPDDLRGLCRVKVGDYRIIYWIYSDEKHIKIYEIEHRSKDYHSVKK